MPTVKRRLFVGVLLVAAGGLTACSATTAKQAPAATATTAATSPPPSADTIFPDESTAETTTPKVASGKVGETVTLTDGTGTEVANVQISKVRFSSGDQYNRPDRGNFLGVYVKTKALANDQSSLWGDIYVTQRGHHYDADACCPEGFKPELDYVTLNTGETAEGWLLFDVPAKHGEVVLANTGDNSKIATWSF
jgi:hypothetical protein